MTRRAGLGLGLATALLAGCGQGGAGDQVTASPSRSPSSGGVTPSASAADSPTSVSTSPPAGHQGPSFGVDRRRWPTTVKAARTVLNRLPKRLDGRPLHLSTDPRDLNHAEASYDPMPTLSVSGEYVTTDAEGDEDFTSHAVGWTSGKTAWVVIAQDRPAAASLVAALAAAAG